MGPDGVAGWLHVELLGDKKFGTGFARGVEHRRGDIHKRAAWILGAFGGDELIGEQDFVANFGARRTFFHGEEDDLSLRKRGVNFGAKRFEIGEQAFGGFAGLEIVFSRVNDDEARRVRDDDAVRVEHAVRKLRAAEATVDRGDARKIGGEARPFTNRRTADEDYGIAGGSFDRVGLGVFIDFGRPFFGRSKKTGAQKQRGGDCGTKR